MVYKCSLNEACKLCLWNSVYLTTVVKSVYKRLFINAFMKHFHGFHEKISKRITLKRMCPFQLFYLLLCLLYIWYVLDSTVIKTKARAGSNKNLRIFKGSVQWTGGRVTEKVILLCPVSRVCRLCFLASYKSLLSFGSSVWFVVLLEQGLQGLFLLSLGFLVPITDCLGISQYLFGAFHLLLTRLDLFLRVSPGIKCFQDCLLDGLTRRSGQ